MTRLGERSSAGPAFVPWSAGEGLAGKPGAVAAVPVAAQPSGGCGGCGARLARDNDGELCSSCERRLVAEPPRVPCGFWDEAVMRDALASWHIGRVIRAFRTHPWHRVPITQEAVGGWLGGLPQPQVSRIENGPPVGDLGRLIPWAQVLRIPGELLWFRLPPSQATTAGGVASGRAGSPAPAYPSGDGVHGPGQVLADHAPPDRRSTGRLVSRLALATTRAHRGAMAPGPAGGHAERLRRGVDTALDAATTAADAAEWERVVDDYWLRNGRVAPAVLLPELLADLGEARARLGDAPAGLRAPMARACGYLSALAASNMVGAGDVQGARRYWRTALRAIDHAGDRPAQALLHATRARFALAEAASPEVALALAGKAIAIAGGTTCAGAAQAHGARALALACLGEHGESVTAIRDLAGLAARLPQAAASAPFGFSQQSLLFYLSRAWSYAGRAAEAERARDGGLALVPPGSPVPLADFELSMAVALIQSGDPSEGARHLAGILRALPAGHQRNALIRQNAARALALVPPGEVGTPTVAEARELLMLPLGAGVLAWPG